MAPPPAPLPAPLLALPPAGQALASAAALLAASGLFVWILYARAHRVLPVWGPLAFLGHLQELGARVGRVLLQWAYWATLLLTLRFERAHAGPLPLAAPTIDLFDNTAARLYVAMADAVVPPGVPLLVTRPTEAVAAQLQVALLVAVFLTLPALLFEAWAFFAPGLHPRERRTLARALPAALILFCAGAGFGFAFVVPFLLSTLYAFAAPLGAVPYYAAGALVGTVVTFSLCFGVAFELPLVLVVLVRLGVAEPHHYLRYWRHATLGIFVVAALVTDPTLVSQLVVGTLLLALYWGGVAASFLLRPVPAARDAPRAAAGP